MRFLKTRQGLFWSRRALIYCFLFGAFHAPVFALSLEEALTLAKENSPEFAASRAAQASSEALIAPSDALPDPRLSLNVSDYQINKGMDSANRNQFERTVRGFSIMQEVPNGGKRSAARQLAEAAAQSAEATTRFTRLNVQKETALAWLNLYFLEQKSGFLSKQQKNSQLKTKTSKAVLTGGGSANDALMARLETAEFADAEDELVRDTKKARALLARFIGVSKAKEPLSGDLPAFVNAPIKNVDEALKDFSNELPEIKMAHAANAAAQAEVKMARADKLPDWGVELGVERDAMGINMAMLNISFSLPLFTVDRQTPKIAAAHAALLRSEAETEARKAAYQQEISDFYAEATNLNAQITRIKEVTEPLVNTQLSLALAGFSSGKDNANRVISARNAQLQNELRHLNLQAELAFVKTRLYFLSGENHE